MKVDPRNPITVGGVPLTQNIARTEGEQKSAEAEAIRRGEINGRTTRQHQVTGRPFNHKQAKKMTKAETDEYISVIRKKMKEVARPVTYEELRKFTGLKLDDIRMALLVKKMGIPRYKEQKYQGKTLVSLVRIPGLKRTDGWDRRGRDGGSGHRDGGTRAAIPVPRAAAPAPNPVPRAEAPPIAAPVAQLMTVRGIPPSGSLRRAMIDMCSMQILMLEQQRGQWKDMREVLLNPPPKKGE